MRLEKLAVISVYIISLKESKRRLDTEKLVLGSNEKFKGRCVFQIFEAISPKHQDFEKLVQELYDAPSLLQSDWFHSDISDGLTLPELGCYLSHYLLWKECARLNQPVIILEDDVALESNFIQALEDCLKSPFDFVRLYGCYWYYHDSNLNVLPKEFVFAPFDYSLKSRSFLGKCKEILSISIDKFSNLSTYKCIHFALGFLKKMQRSHYATHEKEALFLEHFYLTSVYVASTAGYYLTPKGAKTFTEAVNRFKIIEPVDIFMNNSSYHNMANLTYTPCALSLNEHSSNSTIQKPKDCKKKEREAHLLPTPPKKSSFRGLFYYTLNAKKRLKAFNEYSKQYDHLKTPKEV
ncbi:lipopolysaccharide biosynthesis protein [Helicobacter acinonychis]|uniref:Lipopolysaccharide biosynthesis protein n=1 Tax=Helicobacter acinonychis (strain Sheeba) TaxID=382638 RepID=Q17XK7_HELAH|nr:putative lipopolysaccharide biosynthesis protein [Helicobacter acinonychis str. Sheeba]STP04184.1 lipopolysaccharide biosynthesis protein [Helicobacter acinonychis]